MEPWRPCRPAPGEWSAQASGLQPAVCPLHAKPQLAAHAQNSPCRPWHACCSKHHSLSKTPHDRVSGLEPEGVGVQRCKAAARWHDWLPQAVDWAWMQRLRLWRGSADHYALAGKSHLVLQAAKLWSGNRLCHTAGPGLHYLASCWYGYQGLMGTRDWHAWFTLIIISWSSMPMQRLGSWRGSADHHALAGESHLVVQAAKLWTGCATLRGQSCTGLQAVVMGTRGWWALGTGRLNSR